MLLRGITGLDTLFRMSLRTRRVRALSVHSADRNHWLPVSFARDVTMRYSQSNLVDTIIYKFPTYSLLLMY